MVVDQIMNFIFGWAVNISPFFGILFISLVLSLISTLAWKYLTNQETLKALKEKTTNMRAEFKQHKNDPKKLAELNSKMAKENLEMMKIQYKQSIKPMLVTLIPFLFVFTWIRKIYQPFGHVFFGLSGIWSYIVLSIVFSMILRKVLKVY